MSREGEGEAGSAVWFSCEKCGQISRYNGREAALQVCAGCGYHGAVSAQEWIALLCDDHSFEQLALPVRSADPLRFRGVRRYRAELKAARKASGVDESIVSGKGRVDGQLVALVVSERTFLAGSVGAAAGERIARCCELALDEHLPLVLALSSAGFRRQEGAYAGAVLPRVLTAWAAVRRAGLFTLAITSGIACGAAALLATTADVCWREPGAQIAWSAERTSDARLDGGAGGGNGVVVPRNEQRERLHALFRWLRRR